MGGARGAHPPLLILDQTEVRRAEKNFFETAPPAFLRVWGPPPSSPYLKVWIRHCIIPAVLFAMR